MLTNTRMLNPDKIKVLLVGSLDKRGSDCSGRSYSPSADTVYRLIVFLLCGIMQQCFGFKVPYCVKDPGGPLYNFVEGFIRMVTQCVKAGVSKRF